MSQKINNVEALVTMNLEFDDESIFEILQLIHDRGIRIDVIKSKNPPTLLPEFKLTGDKASILKLLQDDLGFDRDGLEEEVEFIK